jgi:hypothetical protein
MRERHDTHAVVRRRQAKVATTLAAWLVAFLIVTALLSVFGDELASMPLALRALVMSGVLMTVMTTVVMPALSVAVGRWLAGPAPTPGAARRTESGASTGPRAGERPRADGSAHPGAAAETPGSSG